MSEALQQKANKTTVSNALQRKANKQDLDSLMETKADVSDLDKLVAVIETKVNSQDFDISMSNLKREFCTKQNLDSLQVELDKKSDHKDLEHLLGAVATLKADWDRRHKT